MTCSTRWLSDGKIESRRQGWSSLLPNFNKHFGTLYAVLLACAVSVMAFTADVESCVVNRWMRVLKEMELVSCRFISSFLVLLIVLWKCQFGVVSSVFQEPFATSPPFESKWLFWALDGKKKKKKGGIPTEMFPLASMFYLFFIQNNICLFVCFNAYEMPKQFIYLFCKG